MRAINVFWIGVAAVALSAAERSGQIMAGSAQFGKGVRVRFTTIAEPPMKGPGALAGGIRTENDRVHRFIVDTVNHQYFGYDLAAEPDGPNRHRVSIEPLTVRPEELQGFGGTPPVPLVLPRYPLSQTVDDGDTIALDLLVSPDGGQKIVDYIQVDTRPEPAAAKNRSAARDFTLDDGPLSFTFQIPNRLFVNGQEVPGPLGMTGKPGGTLWFSIPGRGRFVLSLARHEGFQKAGAIRDNVITFQDGGEQYELRTSGPIIGSGGAWNLYVLRDPLYPATATPQFGTDRLENLTPQQ